MNRVLLCVNSDIGRGNAIGFRFAMIADELRRQGVDFDIIGRANYRQDLKVVCPWYQNYLARILNFLRIYFLPLLNFRSIDIWLFDRFVLRFLKKNSNYKFVHFGEFLPCSLGYLHSQNIKIFLDIPIAHPVYADWLNKQGIKVGVDDDRTGITDYFNKAIALADIILAPSEFVKESLFMAGWHDKDIRIIPFGANLNNNFAPEQIANRLKNEKLTYVFAGNINYRKGIKYLLGAWQTANLSNAELILCGRVYKEIRPEINKYRSGSVKFVGFVDVKSYFNKAHVFVFPSLLEGSAKVVYEAMSYGLPVITTANSGSIVKDGESGFIVPIADVQVLADKIRYFSEHREEITKMGINAFDRVKEYGWEKYAGRVVKIYQV